MASLRLDQSRRFAVLLVLLIAVGCKPSRQGESPTPLPSPGASGIYDTSATKSAANGGSETAALGDNQAITRPAELSAPTEKMSARGTAAGTPGSIDQGSIATAGVLTPDIAGGANWLSRKEVPYEFWETQYFNSSRIGVTHYRIDQAIGNRLNITATTTLQLQRGGQLIRQTVKVQTIEQPDGVVESFFEDTESNAALVSIGGSVFNEVLQLKGPSSLVAVPLPAGTWGPMGIHQLLLRKPMRQGESRQTTMFLPQIHKVAQVTLVAAREEDTSVPDGLLKAVLPIDVTMQIADEAIRSRVWTDAAGQIHKTVMIVGLNLSSYRVPRAEAERVGAQGQVDLLAATSIKLDKPLIAPESAKRIVYLIESQSQDPYRLLSRESNQAVRSISALQSELTAMQPVATGSPPSGEHGPLQTPPTPDSLAASSMIQSDDPTIAELAIKMAGETKEPVELAMQLTRGVHLAIAKKNFSRVFDSAADVARILEGDCTEHAVLLAAVLRNRGISARLASGLIASQASGNNSAKETSFAYHMWTEAWIGDRWLPLDATLGTVAGCGHIKFLETALSDANPYAALLPVLNSLGQLSIEVVEEVR